MTFMELIEKIDDSYPDGRIKAYAEDRDGAHGDTFARAIAIELEETFDADSSDEAQWETAFDAMETVQREIGDVVDRLRDLWQKAGPGLTKASK